MDSAGPPGPKQAGVELTGSELAGLLAKSAGRSATGRAELLTEHSAAVRDAARRIAERIGPAGPIASEPRFWRWVEQAALLHDAGKIAEGFQRQVRPRGTVWGERHEVLSLAYVNLLVGGADGTGDEDARDRLMTATGVAFHHRALTISGGRGAGLAASYPPDGAWDRRFGYDPSAPPGERGQVTAVRHRALLAWFAAELGGGGPAAPDDRRLWEHARELFLATRDAWIGTVPAERGLLAVLLQGAVTLADHSGSAHVELQRHMPLPRGFLGRLARPYPHQMSAAATDGHLIMVAPTGSGKTEGGLAWASAQLAGMPGEPRLVWVLPYRASIDAVVDRFARDLDPSPAQASPDIGVLHSTAASTLLARAAEDDCPPGAGSVRKARARAQAMRLSAQRVRVATPHQLLQAAIAGPRYSSVLIEQANALFVLDELHAYAPELFGRICAAISLWTRLGSRIAVLSATLAQPMIDLVTDSLGGEPGGMGKPGGLVHVVRAPAGTAPDRHRLALTEEPITAADSLLTVARWMSEGHSVLLVANRVRVARRLFEALLSAAHEAWPDDPDAAVLLHSRFRGRDRARIERRIAARHPERSAGEPARRRGGLVVSTQVLEVSLCLDFDRGASELAPVEAVAQRAGRVNRRGRHPDGPVEFRVHRCESPLPYEPEALDAAWAAMRATATAATTDAEAEVAADAEVAAGTATAAISEQTIDSWLQHVYATPWGERWAATARAARDEFTESFLTFEQPFDDRTEFAGRLDESFDTVQVLHRDDVDEYRALADTEHGDLLLAEELLIPLRYGQLARLRRDGLAALDRSLRVTIVDAPYDPVSGLDLGDTDPDHSGAGRRQREDRGVDTIL
ncbi:CRISPR-associated endonuclease/helicase Cas3 [Parafrankia irregularis]|uniref:CRISPR-associated endonuclease/helicase Cas3 n=1 Tax=Parafrankia irregularis TaxID=795642 RepID=A0A0S4QK49_9ACTN|nr:MULTISPECIES: CRISPR-associated helicase/endonuclease Cas3 [Parafrankia]MBE3205661.1 CRISPR-associated helicase/endonuclease Cas3 [Parafrankia sp. CH37]CUU55439.1 CRISPR-associated endonuclease/helicase Cas3 [Parafrankia irregularis]